MTDAELRTLLLLARSGSTQRAWERLHALGEAELDSNAAALTLKGRLLKDRARIATGEERRSLFAEAGGAYAKAALLRGTDSYPLINAAAMALFADDEPTALCHAAAALALIEDGIDAGETPYWREATRAEALLLQGRDAQAQQSLRLAIQNAPQAWEDRAATLRQIALILEHRGQSTEWLDPLRAPAMLHYRGTLRIGADDASACQVIRKEVDNIAPGSGFGALAAGADILIAEALLEQNAELHVILPCANDLFRAVSVLPYGADWAARFDHLLDEATSIECCFETNGLSWAAIQHADAIAAGLADQKARLFETNSHRINIVRDGDDAGGKTHPNIDYRSITVAAHRDIAPDHDIEQLPQGNLRFHLAQGQEAPEIGSHQSLGIAIGALGRDRAAISCSLDDDDIAGEAEATALYKNAGPDTVLASRNVALAAIAMGQCSHIEPLGEMALPSGAVPVYALLRTR
jgi:hypothetical protein